MRLGHPDEGVQEVARNRDQELTGDTGNENRNVSEQHKCINRSRFYRMRRGPKMSSWVTSTFMRHFIVSTELYQPLYLLTIRTLWGSG